MRTTFFLAAFVAVTAMSAFAIADEKPSGEPPSEPAVQTTPDQPTQPPVDQTKDQQAQEDDNKVVCKKEPPPVGSRMGGRKVCRTVAEWRRIQSTARETTTEIQERKVPPPAS
jgi:hypothetical protein